MNPTSVLLVLLVAGYGGIAVLGARSLLREAATRKAAARAHWTAQGRTFPGAGSRW
jgi:hypothetical protein